MFGKSMDDRYATKEELKKVNNTLEKNQHCLNLLQDNVIEIRTGINMAKWILGFSIAVIPVITIVFEEIKDGAIHPQQVPTGPQQIYILPEQLKSLPQIPIDK